VALVTFLCLMGVLVIAWALGRRCLEALHLRISNAVEEGVFAVGLGLGIQSYLVWTLGLLGRADRFSLSMAMAVLALFAAPGLLRSPLISDLRASASPRPTTRRAPLLGVLLVAAGILNIVGAVAPPSFADALAYHFAVPKLWLAQHTITELPWHWESYQPFTVEMLFLLGMVLSGETLSALFHWLFGVLLVGGLYAFQRHHVPGSSPLIAVCIFYLSGLIAWESTSGFVDLGLAFFAHGSLFGLLNWLERREETAWLAVSGVFAGLAAGSKYIGLFVPGAVLLTLLAALRNVRPNREMVKAVAIFGTSAFLVASPWYVKNAIQTGDPLYPFGLLLLGHADVDQFPSGLRSALGVERNLLDFVLLPFLLTFSGERFGKSQMLGPLYLSFLPLLIGVLKEHRVLRLLAYFALTYLALWFFLSQQVRFLLPVLPVAASGCALSMALLDRWGPRAHLTGRTVLLTGLGFGLLVTAAYNRQFFPVTFGMEPPSTFLSRNSWFYDDLQWMNGHLPRDAKILLLARTGYYLDRDYISSTTAFASEEVDELIDQYQVTHVFCAGESCQAIRSQHPDWEVLRESETELMRSRTFGNPRETVKTAVFQLRGTLTHGNRARDAARS
jgi:4-amino-4-deoxy-L-arabinose transferase-like glycosyltransferase